MNANEISALRLLRKSGDGDARVMLEKIACKELADYEETADYERDALLAMYQGTAPQGARRS